MHRSARNDEAGTKYVSSLSSPGDCVCLVVLFVPDPTSETPLAFKKREPVTCDRDHGHGSAAQTELGSL